MSYRIYVNHYQCLGNNECPEVLINELKKQGCEVDEDYCFYDFEIKDLEGIIEALEQYIIDTNNWAINKKYNPSSIADFSDIFKESKEYGNGLTWKIEEQIEYGYLFVSINFLKVIKDDYEEYYDYEDKTHRIKYRIKKGHHIYMSAF